MTEPQPPLDQRYTFQMTPEVDVGVYANFVNIWHMSDCFIFDFSVLSTPPSLQQDEDGKPFLHFPARIASRVRVPPEQVFEIMKALNTQLEAWETEKKQSQPPAGS